MAAWIYDIETIKNFFCICFESATSDEKVHFIIDENINNRLQLYNFIKGQWLIGYNNKYFDNVVTNYICSSDRSVDEIFNFSQLVIKSDRDPSSYPHIKPFKYSKLYQSIDLMTLLYSKNLQPKLKELQVTMKYPNVQELPFKFDTYHTEEMKLEQLKYCYNDVSSTKRLYELCLDDLKLRHSIKKEFGIDCYSKDPVKTGVDLFKNLYCKKTGLSEKYVDGLRTPRPIIHLKDIILDKIQFKSNQFNTLLTNLKNTSITETKGSLNHSVLYGDVLHMYGTGGIHSKDRAGIVEPNDDEIYIDADVASLYPSILIEYGFKPEHLTSDFITVYKQLKDDRIAAKKSGDKLIAETYKLSLNGTYGNLINAYSWLFDTKAAMSITLNGQLFLSMLSEQLTDAGFRVDSLNTDGITTIVKKDRQDEYYSICKEWEKHTNLELEFAYYQKVVRLSVNDYFAIYTDGKIKYKGSFLPDIKLGKGYDKPIIAKSIIAHYTKGIPFDQFIREHDDIYDFLIMQRVGEQYEVSWNNSSQQHINRYYVSKNSPYLYKIKNKGTPTESTQNMLKGFGVQIFNKYEKKEMKDYNIYYEYYISEARKIINELEPTQLSLF